MPTRIISATRSITSTCCVSIPSCASRRISVVEVKDQEPLPAATDALEWQRYNSFNLTGEHYDLLEESDFAKSSAELKRFMLAHNLEAAPRRSADRAQAAEQRDLRGVRVRGRRDAGAFADRPGARCRARRVPGLRAHHDRDRAPLGRAGALCLGLSLSPPPGQGPLLARCDACVDGGVSAEPRLGRLRSDQQHRRRPTVTFASPSGATTPTCRRRAARSRAMSKASSASPCASSRPRRPCGTRNSCACRSR